MGKNKRYPLKNFWLKKDKSSLLRNSIVHKNASKLKELDAVPKDSGPHKYEELSHSLSYIKNIILYSIIITFSILGVGLSIKETLTEYILIEPFEVPDNFIETGLNGRVLANKIVDKIDLVRSASAYSNIFHLVPNWSNAEIEVDVPGAGISINKLFRLIKSSLGKEQVRITGEIYTIGENTFITARVSGKSSFTKKLNLESLDSTVFDISQEIMKYTYPMMLFHHKIEAGDNYKDCIAIAEYAALNAPDDDDAEAYFDWGWALYNYEKDYNGALVKYKEALEINPGFVNAHIGLGDVLYDIGDIKGAIAKYKESVRLEPSAYAYYSWGAALYHLDDTKGAIDKYKKAIELDSDYPIPYTSWGNVLYNTGDMYGAIAKYEKAIELDPEDADPYCSWGAALYKLGRKEEAIDKYKRALKISPKAEIVYDDWGKALLNYGDKKEAIDKYKEALEINPDFVDAHIGLGDVLYDIGDNKGAIAKYKEVLDIDSTNTYAYYNWGTILYQYGEKEEAISKYKRALELNPKAADVYENWGDILYMHGAKDEAFNRYEKSLKIIIFGK
ncbi:tetratricopeptide repeat protein [Pontibacter sp. 13R65]|uniref:tetratricopeptide repeat protein n=1 Tax=Pontibacter sp. 13R65 TaxID=3127458 RepID=UPI00301D4FC4